MGLNLRNMIVGAGAVAASQLLSAGTDTFFTPLTQSTAVAIPNHVNEFYSPWQTPAGITQTKLLSLKDVEADVDQSTIRVPGLGSGASMFDMMAFDQSGENLFIPHETSNGAGGSRYNMLTGKTQVMFAGDASGVRGNKASWGDTDWGAFDPSTYTPSGTLLFGEEWSGLGRLIEVLNPHADPEDIQLRELHGVPNVSHEGLRFSDKDPAVMYFVDEYNSGSIYKIKFSNPNDYSQGGDVWVLSVDAFGGDPAENYNAGGNAGEPRTGWATWVSLDGATTDPMRNGISSSPNDPDVFGGRPAADEVGGTPYGRPEDIEVGTLASGREVLYFAATSESTVYSVEMHGDDRAMVRVFANENDTPKNQGFLPTTGILNSPDNLAQDALGNIYIIEDKPNGDHVGGDIWFVRDVDNNGVAESIDHFMSIQVDGAEATGMIFNPGNPTQFVVAVQHPDSTDLSNVPDGQGDAVWLFDLEGVVPPLCEKQQHQYGHRDYDYKRHYQRGKDCTNASEFNFVSKLQQAAVHKNR